MAKTIKSEAKAKLAEIISERNKDLKQQADRLIAIASKAENQTDIEFVARLAKRFGGEYSAYLSYSSIQFTIRLQVEGFKKGVVKRILTACLDLADNGSSDYVNSYAAERTYRFRLASGNSLNIECTLKADGPTCRRVQVGEETHTTPIYKIEC